MRKMAAFLVEKYRLLSGKCSSEKCVCLCEICEVYIHNLCAVVEETCENISL